MHGSTSIVPFIDEFGRSFSFFVSKANLRPASTLKDLLAHYKETIEDNLDISIPVMPLGNESGADVVAILKKIDLDALFFALYREQLKEIGYELIEALNIRIKASKASLDANDSLIREMEESVVRIQKKSEELAADIHARI